MKKKPRFKKHYKFNNYLNNENYLGHPDSGTNTHPGSNAAPFNDNTQPAWEMFKSPQQKPNLHITAPQDKTIAYNNPPITAYHEATAEHSYQSMPNYQHHNVQTPFQNQTFHPNPVLAYTNNPISIVEANSVIPKAVAKEIRSEKWRNFVFIILGLLGSACCIFLVALFYAPASSSAKLGIPVKYIPQGWISIIALIIFFMIFTSGVFGMQLIVRESNSYIRNLRHGINNLPQFILTNFKRLIKRNIIFNWVLIPTYILLLIVIGFLIFFNQHAGEAFSFAFWSLGDVPDLSTSITIAAVVLCSLVFIHGFSIILSKRRKANIVGYFGSEVMNNEQIRDISKRTNRICLACFILAMVILFFVISVPLILIRRKKGSRTWTWPWNH